MGDNDEWCVSVYIGLEEDIHALFQGTVPKDSQRDWKKNPEYDGS
jgi:hypothetical protein